MLNYTLKRLDICWILHIGVRHQCARPHPREGYNCYPVVSHKYAPPFAILALVQNAGRGGGGLYAGCDILSRDYALPFSAIKHDLIVGAERKAERCSRR